MPRIFPGGSSVSRSFPSALVGGGGSNVEEIELELRPDDVGGVDSAIDIPDSGDPIDGGMFNEWLLFDPVDCVASMSDDGNEFSIEVIKDPGSSGYLWGPVYGDRRAYTKQPHIVYPRRIMGDFSIEMAFTIDGTAVGHYNTAIILMTMQRPTNTGFGHHGGIKFGDGSTGGGTPRTGGQYNTGSEKDEGSVISWNNDLWLKLDREQHLIKGYVKIDGASYTAVGSDASDAGGGASYIGIGFHNQHSSSQTFEITELNLTGSEWTASP